MEEEEGSSFLFFGARLWARGTGSWERAWRRVGTATGMDAIFVRLQIWFLFSWFISHVVDGGAGAGGSPGFPASCAGAAAAPRRLLPRRTPTA